MPSLTITVTAAQAARAQHAFGGYQGPPGQQVWVDASAADLITALKGWVKQQTVLYEANQAAQTTQATGTAETW